jgi:hypothetical protein
LFLETTCDFVAGLFVTTAITLSMVADAVIVIYFFIVAAVVAAFVTVHV